MHCDGVRSILHVDTQFIHSELADSEEVARVCATTLPVRKSKHSHLVEKAVFEFQRQWQEEVGFAYCGATSPQGPVTVFFPPETKQDRVEIFAQLIEYFFAYDDILTAPGSAKTGEEQSADSIGWEVRKGTTSSVRISAMKQIQSEVFLRLLEIDRKRGNLILRAINDLSRVHGTIGSRDLRTWDDLVQYRADDYGAELNIMSIIYCCELDLTQSDIHALKEVWSPATAAAALVNDLYSFNREVILEPDTDTDTTIATPNSVWYLMKTSNLTVSQAKEILLKDKILPLEREFIAKKAEYLATMNPMTPKSGDIIYFLEMVGLGLSGNWYWHAIADRFHRWAELLQLPPAKLFDYDEYTATCATFLNSQLGGKSSQILESTEDLQTMADGPYYKILHQPIDYLRCVPSKNIRGTIIQALNLWFNAPKSAAAQVEDLIGHLHESSLLLDDIQDSSELRRGRPAVYRVFGVPQTINAATHALTLAFEKVVGLMNPDSSHLIEVDELRNLHVGQAMDLYWTRTGYRPSIAEYLEMNRLKTGALFCLASNLLYIQGSFPAGAIKQTDLNNLMITLGQYFQARDDYINLASTKYQEQKGFAQDLDEGKLSLPMIHLLTQSPNAALIENIRQERARNNKLPADLKQLILDEMRDQKILQVTEETLNGLEAKVYRHLERLEVSTGIKNFTFRFLLDRLREM
ncbi:bifunctional terpene synthase/polyprenyl synthetase family protein [Aspergillus neoniger CBS 115656]|uniref:Terpenoid synthase n=1 Tax=Aspergillus neoniger (strain CBS 115656) TaxID=1448310 RepID=A0A318Y545_ASPNB|nr:terpenoid synthase [Aspergillus neoniger CBS 115656]PYH28577.1 terpenoid synthase [Aspergillus neoniger CBS 115656]